MQSQSSTTRVIPGNQPKPWVKWEDQVTGITKHGPSENTQSQTREWGTVSSKASTPGYHHLMVNEIEMQDSETETEEVQPISEKESLVPEEQLDSEVEPEQ